MTNKQVQEALNDVAAQLAELQHARARIAALEAWIHDAIPYIESAIADEAVFSDVFPEYAANTAVNMLARCPVQPVSGLDAIDPGHIDTNSTDAGMIDRRREQP